MQDSWLPGPMEMVGGGENSPRQLLHPEMRAIDICSPNVGRNNGVIIEVHGETSTVLQCRTGHLERVILPPDL